MTISAAMLISALNALTLSPALCALVLRHRGEQRGLMRWGSARSTGRRTGNAAIVGRLVRVSFLALVAIAASAGGIVAISRVTPTGFLPEEDQGGFYIAVQLPDGASVSRTKAVVLQLEEILKTVPGVANVGAIIGYSVLDTSSAPNSAFVVAR